MSRLGVSFSLQLVGNTKEVFDLTALADDLGYDSVWIPEAWGRDAFTMLAALSVQTKNIRLATGIVNVFSRTPALVAQSIASLDDLSGGRAILGLGASGPRVVERWHSLKFSNVLQRTREFVRVVRLILSGDPVDFDGEIYQVHDFSLAFRPPRPSVPIYLASIGPANIRLTGEIGDGWLPIFASESFLSVGESYLHQGCERANRGRGDITVASYIPTLLGSSGLHLLRRHIAFYIGAMGSYYYRLMVRGGWERDATAIRHSWRCGDRSKAIAMVTEDMVHTLGITGDESQGRARLLEFRKAGVDLPVLAIPRGAGMPAIRATLKALGG